ncbi:protein FAR1-RELATED SEQUENCE 11-like [Dioscorea cayenensis subsp. rotundata]|uniref:Protein FAR1-RELATED SEQUENCE n=1 Tax=Dioscorea cayennensis subsp. rotundata TaxID=55577 RepID=A0AB40D1L3_DIOCR|nr:protein FAR1-RELATED SEQUENCE 11-like [Dioscorea cayenensis subsp. rotundata]
MGRTSMKKVGCLTRRQRCPCGDEKCFIQEELDEEVALIDPACKTKYAQETIHSSEIDAFGAAPYIGQIFWSDDEAQEYYTSFAQKNGFAIRRERSKGNAEHPLGVFKRELVCHRAGPPLARKSGEEKRQRKTKSARCQCEARMVIKKDVASGVTRWLVVKFNNVHNHELLNINDVHHLPSYRYIPAVDREHILVLAKAGCSVSLIMKTLEMEKGVKSGELTFTERDLRNFLQASKCIDREHEGLELLKACKVMKDKNPDFRYDFTLDENNKLEHISWSYADSVRAYKVFGDMVVFDTSYRLYAYDKVVGVWFGVDNHGQIIFLGCVLLHEEAPQAFRWALQSFVKLMDGKFPQTILTDLDMGLKDAALSMLPNTKHAFAIWHIMSKFSSWFSALLGSQYEKFKSEFQRIFELETVEDFSHQWDQMVTEFGLNLDRHVSLLSVHRLFWALPYLQGWFLGGPMTAGHSLSIKTFFRGFLNSQTLLKDFIEQVSVAVDFQTQAGEEATRQENNQHVKIKTCMPMEEHASTILTHHAFDLFQKEIMLSTQFAVFETSGDSYIIRHHLKSDGGHLVNWIPLNEEIHCSCKGFESSGIPCRHALRVLSLKNFFSVPEKYLLVRWCKESSLFPKSNGYKYRSQALCSLASIIVQEASITKDRFRLHTVAFGQASCLCKGHAGY